MYRIAAWIACFAMLAAAFAPSISHMLAAMKSRDVSWLEICTVDGAKLIKVAAHVSPASSSSSSSSSEKALHLEDCPFCSTHAGSVGLPSAEIIAFPLLRGADLMPSLFYQAARPLFAWAAPQSRAPPAFS